MGEEPHDDGSLVTLPLVLGVVVVIGGIAALLVSSLFVYQAKAARADTARLQELIQSKREKSGPVGRMSQDVAIADEQSNDSSSHLSIKPTSSSAAGESQMTLKPGARLRAQRPAHWDQVEIVDILEDRKIKVRWLSGAPGEDVIASELVRSDHPPSN